MNDHSSHERQAWLQARLRQLILMRETGPKSAAWHAARARLIWRLHDEISRDCASAPGETTESGTLEGQMKASEKAKVEGD